MNGFLYPPMDWSKVGDKIKGEEFWEDFFVLLKKRDELVKMLKDFEFKHSDEVGVWFDYPDGPDKTLMSHPMTGYRHKWDPWLTVQIFAVNKEG